MRKERTGPMMTVNNQRHTFLLLLIGGLLASSVSGFAQDVYVASWTIQDPAHQLRQDIAEQIIERANIWLTRDNPEAATVRLDDKLRVTVVGQYNQANGTTAEKLVRVNIGGLILEEDVRNFLDSTLTQEILLRDYFWREENLNVLDPALAPPHRTLETTTASSLAKASYSQAFSTAVPEKPILSFNQSILPLEEFIPSLEGVGVIAGLGYEELGLPGLTYQRLRLGFAANGIRAWYEQPVGLSIGSAITGSNQAAPGAGIAFDLGHFGGSVTWSDPYSITLIEDDTAHLQSKAALLYGVIPVDYFSVLQGWVRVKVGAGYLQGTTVIRDTSNHVHPDRTFDMARLFARAEFASPSTDGRNERSASLGVFGTGISGSYYQRFGRNFGVEVNMAIHGVFGTPAPFLPTSTLWFSPTWFLD